MHIDDPVYRPTGDVLMRRMHLDPDPWQVDALECGHPRILLNCCRQAGKSTAVAFLALAEALFKARSLVLLLSRSQRQSAELFRIVRFYYNYLVPEEFRKHLTAHELELTHGSRIVSLPCTPDTIRGYANVRLLVIDEAARVPDHLYRTVRPMLAVSGGRMVLLSTPCGKRGFFYDTWANGGSTWRRIEVPASQVPRIAPDFLDEERRTLGDSWFRQEYCCSFEALEGLVYPDFARCVVSLNHLRFGVSNAAGAMLSRPNPTETATRNELGRESMPPSITPPNTVPTGRKVGGIDFGFRNPFAAVWGVLDRDGILWLTGEHYERQRPLSYHAEHLPRDVRWYADPSGATEIEELHCAGFTISRGDNALRPGIAAFTARLETDRLRIVKGACPNLLREASLYRYSDDRTDRRSETPVDEYNHALAALRYLVSAIDARQMARMKGKREAGETAAEEGTRPKKSERNWLSLRNEYLWRRLV